MPLAKRTAPLPRGDAGGRCREGAGDGVVAVVLAGGRGSRLEPLTRDRAKPAVPFGGAHRIIDFTLSNCVNSGLRRVLVLTQYKSASLDRHLVLGWSGLFRPEFDESLEILPPQQRVGEHWYRGTADAVFQNLSALERHAPRLVVVLAGDHVYRMDYRDLVATHDAAGADVTIASLPVPEAAARSLGTMRVDASWRVQAFFEKAVAPPPLPGRPGMCLASMGVYCFSWPYLRERLRAARAAGDGHDFGRDLLPVAVATHAVQAHPFGGPAGGYWRDVGTIDAYYEAGRDLLGATPGLDLHDGEWPIRTLRCALPPPKFVTVAEGARCHRGSAVDSLVGAGAVLAGGTAAGSILGPRVRLAAGARVEDSVLLDGVEVGPHARVRRTIVDKGTRLPAGLAVGFDREADEALGLTISPGGVTVVPRGHVFPGAPSPLAPSLPLSPSRDREGVPAAPPPLRPR